MKRWNVAACTMSAALFACAVWNLAAADPQPPGNRDAVLMRAKLAAAQQVLEGLMAGNFKTIGRGAEQLRDLEQWHVQKRDAVYDHYSNEFRRLAEKLTHLAEDDNLEGAMFTYQHLTATCMSCHQYVRDVPRKIKQAALPARSAEKLAATPGDR